jgi:predicted MFS family arabinose efflux permease
MNIRLRSNLRFSFTDGLAYSLMVGMGESFITAFVLARGHGEVAASMISTVPMFLGAILQLAAPSGIAAIRSYSRWVILVASLQTLSLAALAGISFTRADYAFIFAVCSIYWGSGLAAGPAWNAWQSQLIPPRIRTGFFAARSRWCHLFTFLGLVAGGLILNAASANGAPMTGFAVLFGAGAICRLISIHSLARQEPAKQAHPLPPVPNLTGMNRLFHQSSLKRYMGFMLAFQCAAAVSGSLFTPFMLRELRLNYAVYMSLLAAALLARFLALAYARPLIERWGLKKVLFISLALICPVPVLWTQTDSLPMLFLFQATSGIGWGFFELVTFLTLFNELPARDRSSILTYFNLLQTSGIVIGALAGGFTFRYIGGGWRGYEMAFAASTVLRFLAWTTLPGMRWDLIRLKSWIELRPLSVRAHGGLLARPVFVRIPFLRRRKRKPLPDPPKDS